jgi:hypothetical protein
MPLLWSMMKYFQSRAETRDPQVPPLAQERPSPPKPNLQAAPVSDFKEFKRGQLERLEGTGWIDRQQKIVHIPIDRAMHLVLEEGLPKATGSTQANVRDRPAADDREPSVPEAEDSGGRPATNGETRTQPEIPPVDDEVQL